MNAHNWHHWYAWFPLLFRDPHGRKVFVWFHTVWRRKNDAGGWEYDIIE